MSMVINLDEYIPATEAAEMLGVKYPAFWARIKRGQVATIQVGRFHLVRRDYIEELRKDNNDSNPNLDEAAG